MTSVLKFNNWQNTSGTAYGSVLQTVQLNFGDSTSTNIAQTFVNIAGSQFSLTTRGANSKIYIMYNGQSYRYGSAPDRDEGHGIQLYRVAPTTSEVYTPYATWSAIGYHYSTANFAGPSVMQAVDTPNVAAGITLTYRFRVTPNSSRSTVSINYSGYPGVWDGYKNSTSVIAFEIAP